MTEHGSRRGRVAVIGNGIRLPDGSAEPGCADCGRRYSILGGVRRPEPAEVAAITERVAA